MSLDPCQLGARRILVIAPHPDDEALGCGGMIATLAASGRQFLLVFVTDGGASHRGSLTWPRTRLAARRRAEALESAASLGLSPRDVLFLDLPDARMPDEGSPAHDDALDRLAEAVAAFAPSLALLPWRRDPHRDHRDSWSLAWAALRQAGLSPDTLEYAVWLDEIGGMADQPRVDEAQRVVFDVSRHLPAKRAAVAAHLTQTTGLIDDAPEAFRLLPATIDRLCGPTESYWRPLP
ncbi:MAG: PIG-L deacetylase family protein [Phenylobacterium sp.]|nr:PIG-L deacetylase family protein [Phenylobacterium sp.]